jgi:pimeloyl-ACP methyl ester carboxylesterase
VKRRWKILIGIGVVLAVLLVVNTIVVNDQTKGAGVTVEGGEILRLPGGDVQVTDTGTPQVAKGLPGAPIVLLHCYTCSLEYWDAMVPLLSERHRVVRIDLLGHGGSEKPQSGYSMEAQADLVAGVLNELGVEGAVVVGHSMGFDVSVALAQSSSQLVDRLVGIGEPVDNDDLDLPVLATLNYLPVIGEAFWRLTPDFAVKDTLKGELFAPGFEPGADFEDVPVDSLRTMTNTSFEASADGAEDFVDEQPLDERVIASAVPLMVIFGAEDQTVDDPTAAADAYRTVPGARIATIDDTGHSPIIEKPVQTASLILEFAADAGDDTSALPRDVGLNRKKKAGKKGSKGNNRERPRKSNRKG